MIMLASDDNARTKAIQQTHGLDNFTFKIRPLLSVIEDIVSLTKRDDFEDIRDNRVGFFDDIHLGNETNMMDDQLTLKINHISWEILANAGGGSNVQEPVLNILNALSSFFWAGKGVIALAAFAVNYGELWLVNQLQSTNAVAQSLALLDQLPTQMENKSMFHEMAKLIMSLLNLIKCISESVDVLQLKYVDPDTPLVKNMIAQIPEYTYWIIRGIVTCQSRLLNLDESGPFGTDIVAKVMEFGYSMRKQLDLCYQQAEKKRIEEVYGKIKKLMEITSNKDSVKILKALISEKEEMPLYNGHTKKLVKIDTLGNKVILLYITELKNLTVELSFLSEMYLENPSKYEIVWFPVVEAGALSHEKKLVFKELQSRMPWLSFRDVSLLDPAVVKYMKDDWQFEKGSMIKVVDPKGRLMKNHDAMNMILIWGNLADPFNGKREEALWAEAKWGVDLLLKFVVPSAKEWAHGGSLICMFGGDNIEWIQKFRTATSDISHQAREPMAMLYMGTTNKRNEVNNMNIGDTNTILIDPIKTSLFWTRLESMWYSRVQIGMPQESDEITKEVFKMFSFKSSNRGWAIVSRESGEMAKGMGDTMLKALMEYDQWKGIVSVKGLVSALEEYMGSIKSSSTFKNTFMVPKTKIGLPEKMECFECQREMKRAIQFSCCGD